MRSKPNTHPDKPIQKWPTNLVIVRHAESHRNVAKEAAAASGQTSYDGGLRDVDVELTERGRKQAAETGQYLAESSLRFDQVIVSPYQRTRQTAELLFATHPQPPLITYDDRLREIEFGVIDALTKAGIQQLHPGEVERKKKLGKYWYRPPGGESWPDVALRLHSFLGTLTREHAGRNIMVVCHSVVVLLFRKLLERLSEEEILAIDSDRTQEVWNCSLTHYEYAEGPNKLLLKAFAGVHYPPELASSDTLRKRMEAKMDATSEVKEAQ